jgi:hypothetical protein
MPIVYLDSADVWFQSDNLFHWAHVDSVTVALITKPEQELEEPVILHFCQKDIVGIVLRILQVLVYKVFGTIILTRCRVLDDFCLPKIHFN